MWRVGTPPQKKKKIRRVHFPLCVSKTVLVAEETHLAQNAGYTPHPPPANAVRNTSVSYAHHTCRSSRSVQLTVLLCDCYQDSNISNKLRRMHPHVTTFLTLHVPPTCFNP